MKPVIPRYNPETEWLYVPDVPYARRGEKQLCMQLIFPYRHDLPEDELGVGSLADAPEKIAAASCGTYIPTLTATPLTEVEP